MGLSITGDALCEECGFENFWSEYLQKTSQNIHNEHNRKTKSQKTNTQNRNDNHTRKKITAAPINKKGNQNKTQKEEKNT